MPNIKSAKKRVLIAEMRNARNRAAKSELKTAIKKFEVAAAEGNRTEADGAYKVAVKKVDQIAKRSTQIGSRLESVSLPEEDSLPRADSSLIALEVLSEKDQQ